MIYEPYMLH